MAIRRFTQYCSNPMAWGMLLFHKVGTGKTIASLLIALHSIPPSVGISASKLSTLGAVSYEERKTSPEEDQSVLDPGSVVASTSSAVNALTAPRQNDVIVIAPIGIFNNFVTDYSRFPGHANRINLINYPMHELIDDVNKKQLRHDLAGKIVIIDEAHRLLNKEIADSREAGAIVAFHTLIQDIFFINKVYQAKRCIIMTGTPIQRDLADVCRILNFVGKTNKFTRETYAPINFQDDVVRWAFQNVNTVVTNGGYLTSVGTMLGAIVASPVIGAVASVTAAAALFVLPAILHDVKKAVYRRPPKTMRVMKQVGGDVVEQVQNVFLQTISARPSSTSEFLLGIGSGLFVTSKVQEILEDVGMNHWDVKYLAEHASEFISVYDTDISYELDNVAGSSWDSDFMQEYLKTPSMLADRVISEPRDFSFAEKIQKTIAIEYTPYQLKLLNMMYRDIVPLSMKTILYMDEYLAPEANASRFTQVRKNSRLVGNLSQHIEHYYVVKNKDSLKYEVFERTTGKKVDIIPTATYKSESFILRTTPTGDTLGIRPVVGNSAILGDGSLSEAERQASLAQDPSGKLLEALTKERKQEAADDANLSPDEKAKSVATGFKEEIRTGEPKTALFECSKFSHLLDILVTMRTNGTLPISMTTLNLGTVEPNSSSSSASASGSSSSSSSPDVSESKSPEVTKPVDTSPDIDQPHLVMAGGVKRQYLPIVYSYTEDYGLALFAAYLESKGYNYILVHPEQNNTPRSGTDGRQSVLQESETRGSKKTYPPFTEAMKFKSDGDPLCILIHSTMTEGLNYTFNPALFTLEPCNKFGDAEQVYGRIFRRYPSPLPTKPKKLIGVCICVTKPDFNELRKIEQTQNNVVIKPVSSSLTSFATDYAERIKGNLGKIWNSEMMLTIPEMTKIFTGGRFQSPDLYGYTRLLIEQQYQQEFEASIYGGTMADIFESSICYESNPRDMSCPDLLSGEGCTESENTLIPSVTEWITTNDLTINRGATSVRVPPNTVLLYRSTDVPKSRILVSFDKEGTRLEGYVPLAELERSPSPLRRYVNEDAQIIRGKQRLIESGAKTKDMLSTRKQNSKVQSTWNGLTRGASSFAGTMRNLYVATTSLHPFRRRTRKQRRK